MKHFVGFAISAALCLPATAIAQTGADSAAVRQAALDYLDGFYQGDTARMLRAVHPDVNKYGFSMRRGASAYQGSAMTFSGFLESARGVRAEGETAPADAPRGVQILDVMDQTAAVKVTALWGVDYLLLAKYDGRWMIRQVLWQTTPRRSR